MKKFNISKILAVMLILVFVMSFAGCKNKNDSDTSANTKTTTAETESETSETQTEPSTESAFATDVSLKEYYEPYKAFDSSDSEVELTAVYGSGYRDYGGSLTFSEGDKFTLSVGVSKGNTAGTYEFTGESEVTLTYENGDTKVLSVTEVEDSVATEIMVPHGDFMVYFR